MYSKKLIRMKGKDSLIFIFVVIVINYINIPNMKETVLL
jgi:hypothetical protein